MIVYHGFGASSPPVEEWRDLSALPLWQNDCISQVRCKFSSCGGVARSAEVVLKIIHKFLTIPHKHQIKTTPGCADPSTGGELEYHGMTNFSLFCHPAAQDHKPQVIKAKARRIQHTTLFPSSRE